MNKTVFIIIIILGAIIFATLLYVLIPRRVSENKQPQQATVIQAVDNKSHLPADAFMNRIKEPNMTVIDVRTPEEYASGHIEGAINIDFYAPDFTQQLEKLSKAGAYSIYCRSGSRSGKALDIMKDLGFTDFKDLRGGYLSL
ncbi:MAG: rhodanese-like domain-containing protein [Candidatus Paceibacterota bacterium]